MPEALARKQIWREMGAARLAAIDRLLIEGIKVGPVCKQRAITKILREVPGVTRGDCWQRIRHLRKTGKLGGLQPHPPDDGENGTKSERRGISWRPWTEEDEDKLLNWAGYEPVDKIAQRLSRSGRAVRFRLCSLGMSARVSDGWSLRALQKLLRVSSAKLRQFIGSGMLRMRDPRVTASSLARFCQRNCASLDPATVSRIAAITATRREAYTWERVADFLEVDLKQVQNWISAGHLKLRDTFVTDRSFEEFCKKYTAETNLTLIDPATRKWLIAEYGLSADQSNGGSIPRAQKHALTIRTCRCGRAIAGNVYFRHLKSCKVAPRQSVRTPVYEFSPTGKTVGGSTKESALLRHS